MNEIEKAKMLLERLRTRTEARGATAAEAAQAAELAERIAKRYGLDLRPEQGEARYQMREKRMSKWANVLCLALEKRFKINGHYITCVGRPVVLVFRGPEHLTGIAVWLFMAIRKDLDKRSYIAGRAMGRRGGDLVRFRNQFRVAAAWELYERLNPVQPAPPLTQQEIDDIVDHEKDCYEEYKEKLDRMTQSERDREFNDLLAKKHGSEAGRDISIDTNVIGDERAESPRLEHHCSKGGE